MCIPIECQSNSKNLSNGYFQQLSPNSREVMCICCSERRKVDITFTYEEGEQQKRYKDVLFIANAVLTGSSLVSSAQYRGLKEMYFHQCKLHADCKPPGEESGERLESEVCSELRKMSVKVENCVICRNDIKKCEVAQCCCFEEEDSSISKIEFES